MTDRPSIAILGGTGKEGRGLATRWVHAGYQVIIGSRDAARAASVASTLNAEVAEERGAMTPAARASGAENRAAAAAAEIVVLTTPLDGLAEVLRAVGTEVAGKLVVSTVVPMTMVAGTFALLPVAEGSAAEMVAAALPGARVAAAFQTIGARHLLDLSRPIDEDVPVATDEQPDYEVVAALCAAIGARPVAAGPLSAARFIEALTPLLAGINRTHRVTAGVRFTGLP